MEEVLNETLRILHNELGKAVYESAVMMGISFVLSSILGIILGFALYLTQSPAFFKNRLLNAIAADIVNVIRSVPFIILVVFSLPFTFYLVGSKIGPVAASVPMTIWATVFLARLIEGALKEVDFGVIEAALATGAGSALIIRKVLLVEAAPAIARGDHGKLYILDRSLGHGRNGRRRRDRQFGRAIRLLPLRDRGYDFYHCLAGDHCAVFSIRR